jgi:hypothetical protein
MKIKTLTLLLLATFQSICFAVVPTVYTEQAQIVGTGKNIRLYRVPTRNKWGTIRYYDVNITLDVLENGRINAVSSGTVGDGTSHIASWLSPNVQTNKFIPGTYVDSTGNVTCQITTGVLSSGRGQVAMACSNGTQSTSATWVTGTISGHPFQLDLEAANIGQIPGYQNFSWGKIAHSESNFASCMNTGEIISATQISNTIQLNGYNNGNVQQCGTTLTKQ